MKKRKLESFMFHDASTIKEYLEKMAAKGWLLTHASNYFWTYEKIEPAKLTFTVTYFSEASDFNPYPTENQYLFYEYCDAVGWQLASEWKQMQIFYTDQTDPIPIETDEALKLQTIHKSMRAQILGLNLCGLLVITQIALIIKDVINSPFSTLASYTFLVMIPIYTLLLLQLLNTLGSYAIWYFKSKRSINEGGRCYEISKCSHRINVSIIVVMSILLGLELIFLSMGSNSWIAIDSLLLVAVTMMIFYGLRWIMKKMHASKITNIIVSMFFGFILCFVTISFLINYLVDLHWQDREPAKQYPHLPLIVEHMQYIDFPDYSYDKEEEETFLLYHLEAAQEDHSFGFDSYPELEYEIVDVKFSPLYDLCLKELMHLRQWEDDEPEFTRQTWEQTNDKAWHADAVYEYYEGGKPSVNPEYVVCWGNRMVRIRFAYWEPNAAQIKIAADRLSV